MAIIDRTKGTESEIGRAAKGADLQYLQQARLGQRYPKHCPSPEGPADSVCASPFPPRLGQPINIKQVALILGCSPWSVRQTWIPKGLPHLRSAASSKLIFFTDQVVRWIERQQQGGQRK